MDESLAGLIRVSNEVGRNRDLVQGGGGNTSFKTGRGTMYVKASGTSLGEMREGAGYRLVDVKACLAMLDDPELARMPGAEREAAVLKRLMACCLDEGTGRPSVETTLHAMLGRCVVHTHPSIVGGFLCARDGRAALEEIFRSEDPPPLHVGYCDPGFPLALHMRDALSDYRSRHGCPPRIVFLENHGLFASGGNADEALELTRRVFDAVKQASRAGSKASHERKGPHLEPGAEVKLTNEVCAALRARYAELMGEPVLVRFSVAGPVRMLLAVPEAADLARTGPLVPDQMVYCRGRAVWVPMPEDTAQLREGVVQAVDAVARGATTPTCVLVENMGLFAVGASPKLLESSLSTMEAVLDMLIVAAALGGPRPLSEEAVETIRNWEVEHYRRSLAAGARAAGPLAGQVAVVSGAGSGIGRGIAMGLAGKGMHVVLADIDLDAARETLRRIQEAGAPGSAMPARVDVTGESSVMDLFNLVTASLGGVDLLVNCAGIGPMYPLLEFPVNAWRKALEINLTGYFLMGREAARVMARQGTGGNIINLSSKTGLHQSKNHSAYNATKAGEIHLARGWALDLADYGIRVNVVCPGNVFKESKIWNEQYIAAIAMKRGIKPEEVIPYYINMTALKKDIEWQDVTEAVAFLASPAASKITGQTLVVDAGQVFVR